MMIVSVPMASLAATIPQAPANRDPPCTGSLDWLDPKLDAADCAAAIDNFWHREVAKWFNRKFEFMGMHGVRKTPLRPMQTPIRYTVGKTIFVVSEEGKSLLLIRSYP